MTRRQLLVLGIALSLLALAAAVEWRDPSINLVPGDEPIHAPPGSLPFRFRPPPYQIPDVDTAFLHAPARAAPVDDERPRDPSGVLMHLEGSTLYDHPVEQAQYALALLGGYRQTGDAERLARARLQADRLLDRAVAQGGALYFPYPFDFARHGNYRDVMVAPWYSAMAQGQALSVFVRL